MKIWGNRSVRGLVGLVMFICAIPAPSRAAESSLESWVQSQTGRSLDLVYRAISPSDGARGSVMASPSRSEPDYYFHWIRDSALVMREVWAFRVVSPQRAKQTLIDYALFSRKNQLTDNPSGRADGLGLGEPKFHMDGRAYDASWGRPQNDGPALRVLALLGLADDMMMTGQDAFVLKHLYRPEIPAQTLLKADLEYVAHHWQDPSYDLWEEAIGDHFYTRMTQWRALLEGSVFAKKMGDPEAGAFYRQQAELVLESLNRFWSSSLGFLVATRNWKDGPSDKTSNLDIAIVLGVLHAGKSGAPFSVTDDRVIATANELILVFDGAYSVNRTRKNNEGLPMAPGIGRYSEDRYTGTRTDGKGNPWFLTTHAMAEYMLRLKGELSSRGELRITDLSRPFFESLIKKDFVGKRRLLRGEPEFAAVMEALQDKSDAFIRRAKFHTAENGHQSEQFNRVHGEMQGARDLTWSYASFLSLRRVREKTYR